MKDPLCLFKALKNSKDGDRQTDSGDMDEMVGGVDQEAVCLESGCHQNKHKMMKM